MRRRRDLTGWILMAALFIGAMSLIFYILLLRAQHLASMEDRRQNPDGGAQVQLVLPVAQPVVMHATAVNPTPSPHTVAFESSNF